MSYATPVSLALDPGSYEVEVPAVAVVASNQYRFIGWVDGSADPKRTVSLNRDRDMTANYVEVINVADVEFTGDVSNQEASGELVTLTVSKPDGSEDTFTTTTDQNKAFIPVTRQYQDVGAYVVVPSIGADAKYKAAVGQSVLFTILAELLDRTITVSVAVNLNQ